MDAVHKWVKGGSLFFRMSGAHGSVQMYTADHMGIPLYYNVSVPQPSLRVGVRKGAKTVIALEQEYRVCVRPNIT